MPNPYILSVLLHALPGQETTLQNALQKLAETTRKEPGCIQYTVHQSLEKPSLFFLYEVFQSKEDHKKHCEAPHFALFLQTSKECLKEPAKVSIWKNL